MRTPKTMQALVLPQYGKTIGDAIRSLDVRERKIPKLGPAQVLVRVEGAPCNPSDLMFLKDQYGVTKTLPCVPGWEGAGTVVAAGSPLGQWLVGRRVAVGGQNDRDGTWAEYYVARVLGCVPLRDDLPIEQGATLLINPLTAAGLLETARRHGHKAVVQSAAASQVGRMVNVLAREDRVNVLNIVRRQAQGDLLREQGAIHILDSSDPDFAQQLRSECKRLKITAAFDAVAGEMTGTLLHSLGRGGTAYVYGALAEQAVGGIHPIGVIFRGHRVEGFYLGGWLSGTGIVKALRAAPRIQRLMVEGRLGTAVAATVSLAEAPDALLRYKDNMTDGKVVITPNA